MRWRARSMCTIVVGLFLLSGARLAAAESEELSRLMEIQSLHEDEILQIPGVVGIGIGPEGTSGRLEYKVFVKERTPAVAEAVPEEIEGVPVNIVESGEFSVQ